MSGWKFILIWFVCLSLGVAIGFGKGWGLWKLGFELIGSAVALVGAGIGGFIVLYAVMRWIENREYRSGR